MDERFAARRIISVTFSLSASAGAGMVITIRVMVSVRDQLINCSVINALFGTIISFRSQSVKVVARVLILVILPVKLRIVTVSPIRIGFSNKIIKPEIILAKISCKPNPSPTPIAAISHCSFDQSIPSIEKPTMVPMMVMLYLVKVLMA